MYVPVRTPKKWSNVTVTATLPNTTHPTIASPPARRSARSRRASRPSQRCGAPGKPDVAVATRVPPTANSTDATPTAARVVRWGNDTSLLKPEQS
jgi:hypothetical protein